MHLITLAHKGEAQSIIESFHLKCLRENYYEGDGLACLITGEGPFEAAVRTSGLLGSKKFVQVINLGICGTLDPALAMGSIHPVRTCYLVLEGRPQFKSFPTGMKGLDLVTSSERILAPEKAQPLRGVGELVDREAWGVALAAKEHGIPFASYKLISDVAGTLGACELILEKAQDFSSQLCRFLQELLPTTDALSEVDIILPPGFYLTVASRKILLSSLRKLGLREEKSPSEILQELKVSELLALQVSPKERTKRLLLRLEERLDPFRKAVDAKLSAWKKNWEKEGIFLHTDPTWESAEVSIHLKVTDEAALQSRIETLKRLDFQLLSQLRDGKLHVE